MDGLSIRRIDLDEVDSTNNYIKNLIASGAELPGFTLAVTRQQTAGRGMRGNSWKTQAGKNVIFSLLCHPDFLLANRQFLMSEVIALSISRACSEYTDNVRVKWPNDIYCGDEKFCGILIECDLSGKYVSNCILGCGVNVNQTKFEADIPHPTSLTLKTGRTLDREEILTSIIKHFCRYYIMAEKGDWDVIDREYFDSLYRNDGMHCFEDESGAFRACIERVEPSGHLILRDETGNIRRYEFKEVKFVFD